MFYISSALALIASVTATFFCAAAGSVFLLLLGICSDVLLILGTVVSLSDVKSGGKLSALGAGVCSILVLIVIGELIYAIPFNKYPGQTSMLVVPFAYLGVLILHLFVVYSRLEEISDAELMAALKGDSSASEINAHGKEWPIG